MYNGLYEIKIIFSMIDLFLQKTFIGQPKIIQDYIRVFVSLILMKKLIESKFCHNSVIPCFLITLTYLSSIGQTYENI